MDTDWFFLSKQYVTMKYKHGKMFYSLKVISSNVIYVCSIT